MPSLLTVIRWIQKLLKYKVRYCWGCCVNLEYHIHHIIFGRCFVIYRMIYFSNCSIFLNFFFVCFQGYDFNQGVDHDKLLESFLTTGFQATNFGLAVKEVERMVSVIHLFPVQPECSKCIPVSASQHIYLMFISIYSWTGLSPMTQ